MRCRIQAGRPLVMSRFYRCLRLHQRHQLMFALWHFRGALLSSLCLSAMPAWPEPPERAIRHLWPIISAGGCGLANPDTMGTHLVSYFSCETFEYCNPAGTFPGVWYMLTIFYTTPEVCAASHDHLLKPSFQNPSDQSCTTAPVTVILATSASSRMVYCDSSSHSCRILAWHALLACIPVCEHHNCDAASLK